MDGFWTGLPARTGATNGSQPDLGILIAPLVLLALLDAIKEEVLNVSLLRIVESLEGAHTLVLFFHLVESFFEHQNVEISRCIIGVEETKYFVHSLILGTALELKQVVNILLDLVVGRVNAKHVQL